jgi:hypothetical protein
MHPDTISFRIRALPLASALKELSLLVAVSRRTNGGLLGDATDFREWLAEIADYVSKDPVQVAAERSKIL